MYIYARIASFLCLIVLFAGSLFGRDLQRSFKYLEPLIPHFGIAMLIILAFILVRFANKVRSPRRSITLDFSFFSLSAASVVLISSFIVSSEALIVLPIERVHFLKYASLAFFLAYSFNSEKKKKCLLIAFIATACIGTIEEGVQHFHPDRYFDWRDILLNIVGAIFGSGLAGLGFAWTRRILGRTAP